MGFDVTYLGAFVGGLIAFVSPCVLPIVPLYLCYVAGVSLDELTSEEDIAVSRRKVMTSVILFVLGFSTIFTLMGATATARSARWCRRTGAGSRSPPASSSS